jgi:hypothetical protein
MTLNDIVVSFMAVVRVGTADGEPVAITVGVNVGCAVGFLVLGEAVRTAGVGDPLELGDVVGPVEGD